MSLIKDWTGQIIGPYKFLSISHINRYRHAIWNAECIEHKRVCKKDPNAAKRVTYCRCADNRSSKDICLDQLYQRYKHTTRYRKKKIEFNLEKEYFVSLVQMNCFYCDAPPANKIVINKKHSCLYNGLDRIDNDIGYVFNNVVPCCWDCNEFKSSRSFIEFMQKIDKIHKKLY